MSFFMIGLWYNSHKNYIMKNVKTLCIIAIVSLGMFATSCTPENLDNDQTEQQIDKFQKPLQNG